MSDEKDNHIAESNAEDWASKEIKLQRKTIHKLLDALWKIKNLPTLDGYTFTRLQEAIEIASKALQEQEQCKSCLGTREVDDAEPGDIFYNTYPCPDCKKESGQ